MKSVMIAFVLLVTGFQAHAAGELSYDESQSLTACAVQLHLMTEAEDGEDSALNYLGTFNDGRWYEVQIKDQKRGILRYDGEEIVHIDRHGRVIDVCG